MADAVKVTLSQQGSAYIRLTDLVVAKTDFISVPRESSTFPTTDPRPPTAENRECRGGPTRCPALISVQPFRRVALVTRFLFRSGTQPQASMCTRLHRCQGRRATAGNAWCRGCSVEAWHQHAAVPMDARRESKLGRIRKNSKGGHNRDDGVCQAILARATHELSTHVPRPGGAPVPLSRQTARSCCPPDDSSTLSNA